MEVSATYGPSLGGGDMIYMSCPQLHSKVLPTDQEVPQALCYCAVQTV